MSPIAFGHFSRRAILMASLREFYGVAGETGEGPALGLDGGEFVVASELVLQDTDGYLFAEQDGLLIIGAEVDGGVVAAEAYIGGELM